MGFYQFCKSRHPGVLFSPRLLIFSKKFPTWRTIQYDLLFDTLEYVANSKRSIRPLSFGISNDVLVSTEKYPILFRIPEPVTESQKKYHAALKALEMKFNEAKKELEKKFMEAKSQLDKKFGIVTSPSPTFQFGYHHCY